MYYYYDSTPVSIVLWFKRKYGLGTSFDLCRKVHFLCLRPALWCNIGQCFFVLSPVWRCTECLCAWACLWDARVGWVCLQILHHTSCQNIEYFSCMGWLVGWFMLVDSHSTFIMQSIHSKIFEELPFAGGQAWSRMPGACAERLWDARLWWDLVLVACWEFETDWRPKKIEGEHWIGSDAA